MCRKMCVCSCKCCSLYLTLCTYMYVNVCVHVYGGHTNVCIDIHEPEPTSTQPERAWCSNNNSGSLFIQDMSRHLLGIQRSRPNSSRAGVK